MFYSERNFSVQSISPERLNSFFNIRKCGVIVTTGVTLSLLSFTFSLGKRYYSSCQDIAHCMLIKLEIILLSSATVLDVLFSNFVIFMLFTLA